MRFKKYFDTKFLGDSRHRVVLIVAAIVLAGLLLFFLVIRLGSTSTAKFYVDDLEKLGQAVEELAKEVDSIPENKETEADLNRYRTQLDSIQHICKQMSDYQGKIPLKELNDKLKNKLSSQKQLCQDLNSVSAYAKNQAQVLRPYLLLDITNLPRADSPAFNQELNYIVNVTSDAAKKLKQLDDASVQDPALQELITLVEQTTKLGGQAKENVASKNYAAAQESANALSQSVQTNRYHLLTARTYFWKNTIRIESLNRSIAKLANQFNEHQ